MFIELLITGDNIIIYERITGCLEQPTPSASARFRQLQLYLYYPGGAKST